MQEGPEAFGFPPGQDSGICQMAGKHIGDAHVREIKRQINRLTHLEEALLLLSRIDAGTLVLNRKPTDV